MAIKNHALDDKITASAMQEFMTYGFQAASINKIAENAGITTGAVYTRYKSKDDLFCSLLRAPLEEMAAHGAEVAQLYGRVRSKDDLPLFLQAMQTEMLLYMEIMYKYYEPCILLYCKSEGSSAEKMLQDALQQKVSSTIAFLEGIAHRQMPGVEILLRQQFVLFTLILQSDYTKEQALEVLSMVQRFNEAGWKELFQQM